MYNFIKICSSKAMVKEIKVKSQIRRHLHNVCLTKDFYPEYMKNRYNSIMG